MRLFGASYKSKRQFGNLFLWCFGGAEAPRTRARGVVVVATIIIIMMVPPAG
jgi:hypothetical protein